MTLTLRYLLGKADSSDHSPFSLLFFSLPSLLFHRNLLRDMSEGSSIESIYSTADIRQSVVKNSVLSFEMLIVIVLY